MAGDTLNLTNPAVTEALLDIEHMVTNIVDADANAAFVNLYRILGPHPVQANLTYTAQPIAWRAPGDAIWDTRANINETPTAIRMVQKRTTLGIRFEVAVTNLAGAPDFNFTIDLVPYKKTPGTDYVNFSDYSSVFFTKAAYERLVGFTFPNPAITPGTNWNNIPENKMSIYIDNNTKTTLANLDPAMMVNNFPPR